MGDWAVQVTLLEHNHSHALKNSQSILRDCVRWALALFRLGVAPQFFHLNPFFVQRLSKVLFCCMLRLPSAQQQQRAAKAAMCAPSPTYCTLLQQTVELFPHCLGLFFSFSAVAAPLLHYIERGHFSKIKECTRPVLFFLG